jgi:hypothetical protein
MYWLFYVHVTVHRNEFIYNKTNQMLQFPKFTPAWNSTCFRQFLCLSSGVYSLYTRHWYMSYRSEDSFRAGPAGQGVPVVWFRECRWFGSESAGGLVQRVLVVWFRECWWFGSGSAGGLVRGVLVVSFCTKRRETFTFWRGCLPENISLDEEICSTEFFSFANPH